MTNLHRVRMSPLVSIIVPVYNTAEYVEECIQSILSQSYKNIELILVNDGSTDGSGEICRRYSQKHNVIYVEQENAGAQAAREYGVKKANGEWIMFVDSDDYVLKDCVAELYALTDGVDIVIGSYTRNEKLKDAPDYFDEEDYLYLMYCQRIPLAPWGKLFRKELFGRCPMAFVYKVPVAEDYIMNLALARVNQKIVAVWKKPVYFYRERRESAFHSFPLDLDYCYSLCNILDSVAAGGLKEKALNQGKVLIRLIYYKLYLNRHGLRGNRNHPLVKETVRLMKNARGIRLSDKLLLYVSDWWAIKFCFLLEKILIRIEQPSMIIRDFKRGLSYD